MKIKGFGKLTEKDILEFEEYLGFELPQDYRKFLKEYNGGIPDYNKNCFYIKDLKEETMLDVLYGINIEKNFDLKEWNDEYGCDLLPKMLIIGSDPGGMMIILSSDEKDGGIYLWDHAHEYEQSTEELNSYKIADSFQEFIENLKEYEE